jgi:hypothetical protein
MNWWSFITRRIFLSKPSSLSESEMARLLEIALADDEARIRESVAALAPDELRELAREVLRVRASEAIDLLLTCAPCHQLLSGGGYDPAALLESLRASIGRGGAQMDIAESGGGGSQRGQGYKTQIRFGPREFLTGTALDGMTIRESQLQVVLHELAHAAGDVIPPDGGNAAESVRNQHRITRACLSEVYERISAENSGLRIQESE